MMHILTKEECEEQEKELIKFCKMDENHCLMYNYMMTIEGIRKEVIREQKIKSETNTT